MIEEAIKQAKTPGMATCPECGDTYASPMDKLSIAMYGKCSLHTQEHQNNNLLEMAPLL